MGDIELVLSENKGFVDGIKGYATFVIDKYTINHADEYREFAYRYAKVHVADVKDIEMVKGYDEALKEQQAKENTQ